MKQNEIKHGKLKVDFLRHISDQGLALQMADPKLQAVIDGLKQDGIIILKAGRSKLTVTTLGRVTLTEFESAVRGMFRTLHYYEQGAGLKTSFRETHNSCAFAQLERTIFRRSDMPVPALSIKSGRDLDSAKKWLGDYAWALAGEHGLRAKAVDKKIAEGIIKIAALKNSARLEGIKKHTLESKDFTKRLEASKESIRQYIADRKTGVAELKRKLASLEEAIPRMAQASEDERKAIASSLLAAAPIVKSWLPLQIPGLAATTTPEITEPNYKVTLSESGNLMLSSGIKCPFTLAGVKAWLRGEGGALQCSYGTVSRIEASTKERQPIVLLKCGCHYVHPIGLDAELDRLLEPSHKVAWTEGRAPVALIDGIDPADFLEAARQRAGELIEALEANFNSRIAERVAIRKELKYERDNKDQVMAAYDAEIARIEAEIAAVEADPANKQFDGEHTAESIGAMYSAIAQTFNFVV